MVSPGRNDGLPAIAPDAARADAWVAGKRRAALIAALLVLPPSVSILVVEVRAMLLVLVLAIAPIVPWSLGLAVRRRLGPGGAAGLACRPEGVELTIARRDAPTESRLLPWVEVEVLVAHPEAVVLVHRRANGARTRYVIPAGSAEVAATRAHVATRGVPVLEEPTALRFAGVLARHALAKVLGVVTAALVLAAASSAGLAATGRGGSYGYAAAALGAALFAATLAALVHRWFSPSA